MPGPLFPTNPKQTPPDLNHFDAADPKSSELDLKIFIQPNETSGRTYDVQGSERVASNLDYFQHLMSPVPTNDPIIIEQRIDRALKRYNHTTFSLLHHLSAPPCNTQPLQNPISGIENRTLRTQLTILQHAVPDYFVSAICNRNEALEHLSLVQTAQGALMHGNKILVDMETLTTFELNWADRMNSLDWNFQYGLRQIYRDALRTLMEKVVRADSEADRALACDVRLLLEKTLALEVDRAPVGDREWWVSRYRGIPHVNRPALMLLFDGSCVEIS